jgi:hypothetical protein
VVDNPLKADASCAVRMFAFDRSGPCVGNCQSAISGGLLVARSGHLASVSHYRFSNRPGRSMQRIY